MNAIAATFQQTTRESSDGRASSPGTSLPAPLRRDLETAFKYDFAGVRVHTDRQAEGQTRAVGARAFTVGRDISFAPGAYSPGTAVGRRLIAHELTHVVQQGGSAGVPEPKLGASGAPGEQEAQVVAERVAHGRSAGPISAQGSVAVQRQADAGAPEPDDLPVPVQANWAPSTPGVFSILVDSAKAQPRGASGSASSGRGVFPLSSMGRLEHFCSTPADYPLQIRFYLDAMAMPRSQPFRPPALSVIADFTPTGGSPRRIANAADSSPRYLGPGWPLAPAFGDMFAAASSQSGVLTVRAGLSDPDTGTSVVYSDSVVCELVPCV